MLDINETELVFTFPDVDEEAILRIHFCPADVPNQRLRIDRTPGIALRLAAEGPFVMYLEPNPAHRECLYRALRYPFALLVSFGERNAITGHRGMTLQRSPQNYFTSPPQGGIDGYFQDGRVHPFRPVRAATGGPTHLEIRVHPLKSKAMAYFRLQGRLIPGPDPSALRGITLLHGGERQCEPIYEDICNLGSWDQDHVEKALLCIGDGS